MQTRNKISLIFTTSSLVDAIAKENIKDPKLQKLVIGGSDTVGAVLAIIAVIHHFRKGSDTGKALTQKTEKIINDKHNADKPKK